jgi:hypothetical protein
MHGIYISMNTVALTSPQGAVVRGIVGQRVTYRAYRALFSRNRLLLQTGKTIGLEARTYLPVPSALFSCSWREAPLLPAACILSMHD